MKKSALIYFLLAGACFFPAFILYYEAEDNWTKYILMTLLFIGGIFFSVKQADHMGKRIKLSHDRGFIYIDPLTKFQVFMDLYKGTFHDIITDEELGTFTGEQIQSTNSNELEIKFTLNFYSQDLFREATKIKK